MEEVTKKDREKDNFFDLNGKVALITGGAYGLGKLFCETLAEYGADIAIGDIQEEATSQTAAQLEKFGRKSLAIKADVSSPEDVQHMVEETVKKSLESD